MNCPFLSIRCPFFYRLPYFSCGPILQRLLNQSIDCGPGDELLHEVSIVLDEADPGQLGGNMLSPFEA